MNQAWRIDRREAVLAVIDVQEKLLPVIAEKERVLDNTAKLVRFAGIIGLPVVVTEQDKLGSTVADLGEPLGQAPRFSKITFDCFGEQAFADYMARLGRSSLIVCGIEAHICVAQTVLTALEKKAAVHVVGDAAGSRSPHNKDAALARLRRAGAVITTTGGAAHGNKSKKGRKDP